MITIKQQAEWAALRVDQAVVKMGIIEIISFFTTILPMLVSCWNRNDASDPALAAEEFREYNERHPQSLRRRVEKRVRRLAKANGKVYTDSQVAELARAIIQQGTVATPTEAAVCCVEAGVDL